MNTEPTSNHAAAEQPFEPPFFLMTESQGVAGPKPDLALTLPQRAAAALKADEVKAKIKEAVAASAHITAVIDPDGRQQAHRAGMVLLKLRTGIKAAGKSAREDATAFSKAVIKAEDELVDLVQPEEERILALRDAFDETVRREEETRAKAEKERVEKIEHALNAMRAELLWASGKDAARIAAKIEEVKALDIGADFWQEYHARAIEVRDDVLAQLELAHAAQLAAEQELVRIKAEQEAEALRVQEQAAENLRVALELEKQQDALAERKRVALAQAKELERVQAELRAAQEKLEADRKEFEAAQQAAADKAAADEAERIEEANRAQMAELIDVVEVTEVPVDPAPRDESHLRTMVDRQAAETASPVWVGVDTAAEGADQAVECTIPMPLSFAYDEIADVLTVEGIQYAGEIFRQLGGMMEVGQQFTLVARDDGVVTIYKADQA